MIPGRPLTPAEAQLVGWLLRRPLPGVDALREQVGVARALEVDKPSLTLSVPIDAQRSVCPDGPVPGQVWAYGPSGETLGTLVLWVTDGVLSALEYGWVTDEPPTALPAVEGLRDLADPGSADPGVSPAGRTRRRRS